MSIRWASSSRKFWVVLLGQEVAVVLGPSRLMVFTTRSTNWATLVSRSGEPSLPWKYLLGDDVGGRLRPVHGDFDIALLKNDGALIVANGAVRVSHWTSS